MILIKMQSAHKTLMQHHKLLAEPLYYKTHHNKKQVMWSKLQDISIRPNAEQKLYTPVYVAYKHACVNFAILCRQK